MKWTHYLRCDECGVDAGKACRDEHDSEALEVCDGRRLHVNDSASRTKTSNHHGVAKSKAQINRHKKGLELPVHVPCSWCGVSTKLLGGAVNTGSTFCSQTDCQKAKRSRKDKARRDRDRVARATLAPPPPLTRPCHWCGVSVSAAGRAHTDRPCCGAAACVQARRESYRPRTPPRPPIPCAWCDRPVEHRGNRVGARWVCCGDLSCKYEIEQIRLRKATDPQQQQHA